MPTAYCFDDDGPVLQVPSCPAPFHRWSVEIGTRRLHGETVDWYPRRFVFAPPDERPIAYEPALLQEFMPRLADQLCSYSETWFQAARRERRI